MKKALKFILILLVVAAISFAASVFLSSKDSSSTETAADTGSSLKDRFDGTTKEYSPAAKGSTKITSDEVDFLLFLPDRQEIRYYNTRTGEIKAIKLASGNTISSVATIKARATALTWSPDGTEVIGIYPGESIYTNIKTNTSKTISENIINPRFSRTSSNIAYLYYNASSTDGNISIADSQFKNYKNILKTRLKNWELQWTDERRLSLIATSTTSHLNSLFLLEIATGNLESLVDSKESLETNWAPDGNQLVFSRRSRKGLELYYLNLADRSVETLNLFGRASKCAWTSDSSSLYCAIPDKALTPDGSNGSEDSFVKIATLPLRKPEVLYTSADASFVDARDLIYSGAQHALFFKNFKDGRLYELPVNN